MYQNIYLQTMFNEPQRTQPFNFASDQKYAQQLVYGCGPQSIPIVDPQVVLQFQKAMMTNRPDLFERTLSTQDQGNY